jgi:hypothetical protein
MPLLMAQRQRNAHPGVYLRLWTGFVAIRVHKGVKEAQCSISDSDLVVFL